MKNCSNNPIFFGVILADGSCDGIFCDSNAFCKEISVGSQRLCLCNAGFIGNGTHCSGKCKAIVKTILS